MPEQCFWFYDCMGEKLPCNNPKLLEEIISCKKSVNFHIKQYAEGFQDFCEPITYYLDLFGDNRPDWIELSLRNQVKKILTE